MSPPLALLLWFILLLAVLRFDPAGDSMVSPALWVPLIWMFILGSRLPSQWVSSSVGQSVQALEEGSPLDRSIDLVLILLSIGVLRSRSFKWAEFFSRNLFLTAYVAFALVSVFWSDFPFVAFKRWFRDLGNYTMILVVLSDSHPLEAIRTFLRRLTFLLVPLSIVLINYYPDMGKGYDLWTGTAMCVGVTTGKNLLGLAALLGVLTFFWDVVTRWSNRKQRKTKVILLFDFGFLAMSLRVLNQAHTATSNVCLLLGCMVIAAVHSKLFRRRRALLKALIPASFILYLILSFGFDMAGSMAQAIGKDPTLTDRTKIWAFVLGMHTNPIFGTGYESFWMGSRVQLFWQNSGLGHINEAHNGYLEVYLNLGLVGLFLLAGFLIASYRTICRRLSPISDLASITLALWIIMLFFSMTEAGFRSGLMWCMFLLGTIAVPNRYAGRSDKNVALYGVGAVEPLPDIQCT
jgi:exopolysaccharide production protein ExoQ